MSETTSPDEIKAGTYELVAMQWDQPTSKPGEPFTYKRHRKGDKVELDAAEARRLVTAGAVRTPGAAEQAEIDALRARIALLEAQLPQQAIEELVTARTDGEGTSKSKASKSKDDKPLDRPALAAGKDAWVAYVVSKGTGQEQAEGMTVAALQELYPA